MFACWTYSHKLVLWSWEYTFFKLSPGPTLVTWSKGHVASKMGTSHCNSAPCLVWCSWVSCSWRCNAFNLSRDLTWSPHWEVMRIYGWELIALCHYPDKPCDYKHCDGGNIFLIYQVTSREHVQKFIWIYGWKPLTVSYHLAMLGCHWSSASGDIKYLLSHEPTKPHNWGIK